MAVERHGWNMIYSGEVKQKQPKQVWSYKLQMFVSEGTKEYDRIVNNIIK